MNTAVTLKQLQSEMQAELVKGILPFWIERTLDHQYGGFAGRVTHDGTAVGEADKAGILNARILWTFAAAYRMLENASYRQTADRAYRYLEDRFWDADHGGIYWMLDYQGHPIDNRKHVYAQAFAIYGLSEYHRATRHEPARERAIELYRLLEGHCADDVHGGYVEACSREWRPLEDVRLSVEDDDEPKSMNTHLHVLEAYTTLYRVWPDAGLRARLEALVDLFLDTIIDADTSHLILFFEEDWTPTSKGVSFGHDIEASWLLMEAVDVLGDEALRIRVRDAALAVVQRTLTEGLDDGGGLFNERDSDGTVDDDKHWWPQAEAVVGFVNAFEETGNSTLLQAAVSTWDFIRRCVVDAQDGEWHERVARDGTRYEGQDKVRAWKGPYHNGRACLEIIERANRLHTDGEALPGRVRLDHVEDG